MEELTKLSTLMDLAEQVGITVRKAPAAGGGGEHPGGALVKLKNQRILFLDTTASTADQVAVAAASLREEPSLKDQFLPPEIRELLEQSSDEDV